MRMEWSQVFDSGLNVVLATNTLRDASGNMLMLLTYQQSSVSITRAFGVVIHTSGQGTAACIANGRGHGAVCQQIGCSIGQQGPRHACNVMSCLNWSMHQADPSKQTLQRIKHA